MVFPSHLVRKGSEMLLPQEIAEQLTPDQFMELETTVAETWDQAYGIVGVKHTNPPTVVIELGDRTRHEIKLSK
jgi:hypothetical protein